jgi:hypothetical protein
MKMLEALVKPGLYVLILAVVLALKWEPNQSFFWCSILYALIILNRRTENQKIIIEQSVYDENIPAVVDKIILECLNEYIVLNKGWKEKEYIREEDEKEIINALIEIVLTRMSKTMLRKIRAYYNEELAEEVITEKIYMLVLNYTIENNMIEESNISELESAKKRKSQRETVDIL